MALLAPQSVWAGCPAWPQTLPVGVAAQQQALDALAPFAGACARSADYHARRGALLLALQRPAEAAESLERAILLNPHHAAARLDYADTLAALGDRDSARALAEQLLGLGDIPAAARQHLQARLQQWQAPLPRWETQAELAVLPGWESNLNGGPATSSVWLTLPEGVVSLPLADSDRPRAGAALLYDAHLVALRPLDERTQLLLRTQWRLRDAAGTPYDYLIAQADAAVLQSSALGGQWLLQAAHSEQGLGGQRLFAETRLSVQHEWFGRCAPRLAVDHGLRRYPAVSVLGGVQTGARAGLRCSAGPWQLDGDLRLAHDRARQADRPGGDQRWAELRLRATWQGGRHRAELEASLARVDDREGYSPLLEAGRRRSVSRQALRIELARRLDPRWELAAGMDAFRQRSSLALFELDNLGLYFGARYRY